MEKNERYEIEFQSGMGLCNKIFCLMSACQIAIQQNIKLTEPIFRWKKENIPFSDIYDFEYFNNFMKKYNKGQNVMILLKDKEKFQLKKINKASLWFKSECRLKKIRGSNQIDKNSIIISVLSALKLNEKYNNILLSYPKNLTGIHIRIERDWQHDAKRRVKKNNIKEDEKFIVDIDSLISMYKKCNIYNKNIFFTTGENQEDVKNKLKQQDIVGSYFFNNDYPYEINAAINFELCVQCGNFIGSCRSTYSNLISLKKKLINSDTSFIYNYKDCITKRYDIGLHCTGENINKKVVIK